MSKKQLQFWTAQYRYSGPYRLDISIKGNDSIGKIFTPTWNMVNNYRRTLNKKEYTDLYHVLMLRSYKTNYLKWQEILNKRNIVFVCFCKSTDFCHRKLLANYLVKLGAKYMGEITNLTNLIKWEDYE